MKLFKRKVKEHFRAAELKESISYLKNPGCGWYHIHTFSLEQEIDMEELKWCVCGEETLALILFDIGAYRSRPLPDDALQKMRQVLSFFEEERKQFIVRIVYDREGKGLEHEPDSIDVVELHMRQTGAVLRTYEEALLLVQGLLVGSWGELHGSKFLSEEKLKRLWSVMRRALGENICMAVRKPSQWRMLFAEGTVASLIKTGIFDDGMFGSDSNLGTYGYVQRIQAGWKESWCRQDELTFLAELSGTVPYGGEAVGMDKCGTLKEAVSEFQTVGVCYLNSVYDGQRMEEWKQSVWQNDTDRQDVWNGSSGYDYIGCHLGYRFVIREVEMCAGRKQLEVVIENTGFTTIKEAAVLQVHWKFSGEVPVGAKECTPSQESDISYEADADPTKWKPQIPVRIPVPLPTRQNASFRLYLQCRRKRDGREIRFANEPASEAGIYIGLFANG